MPVTTSRSGHLLSSLSRLLVGQTTGGDVPSTVTHTAGLSSDRRTDERPLLSSRSVVLLFCGHVGSVAREASRHDYSRSFHLMFY